MRWVRLQQLNVFLRPWAWRNLVSAPWAEQCAGAAALKDCASQRISGFAVVRGVWSGHREIRS